MSVLVYNIITNLCILLAVLPAEVKAAEVVKVGPFTLTGELGSDGTCPTQDRRRALRETIKNTVRSVLGVGNARRTNASDCGSEEWTQVVNLDMTDTTQDCPSKWMQYNSTEVRACERIQNIHGGCEGTFFPVNHQYNKVCGRVTGYQVGGSAAFGWTAEQTIDSYYLCGLSLTHGSPRTHIWTFATGLFEGDYPEAAWHCPCTEPSDSATVDTPSFVRKNYFCESGNPSNTWIPYNLYSTDPLWDGEQCESEGLL